MTQATVGLQIGGEGYSEIVFFQDERAFQEFTNGNFEFGAGAQAVVVTAAAQGQAGTTGASAGASAGNNNAATAGNYYKGLATLSSPRAGLSPA
jgi:lipid-binding SYLF domain-containing protein